MRQKGAPGLALRAADHVLPGSPGVLYLPRLASPGGMLVEFPLEVFQIIFQLQRASAADTAWLQARLDCESRRVGACIEFRKESQRALAW